MTEWLRVAHSLVTGRVPCALVTLCALEGSVPAGEGAKLLVWADGQVGTIGGGNLEWTAIEQARKLIAQSERSFLLQDYPLGALLRQCCGGYVRLLIERLDSSSLPWIEAVSESIARGEAIVLQTEWDKGHLVKNIRLDAPGFRGVSLLTAEGRDARSRRLPREDWRGIVEALGPRRLPVFVFGAGHVGVATLRVLSALPLDLSWIDSRPGIFPPEADAAIRKIHSDDPPSIAREAPEGAAHIVLTHSHDLDFGIVAAILSANRFGYCGLIGSKTKRVRFVRRLRDRGLADAVIARLSCPIGLPSLKSKIPAVIGIAIAAEIAELLETRWDREEPRALRSATLER